MEEARRLEIMPEGTHRWVDARGMRSIEWGIYGLPATIICVTSLLGWIALLILGKLGDVNLFTLLVSVLLASITVILLRSRQMRRKRLNHVIIGAGHPLWESDSDAEPWMWIWGDEEWRKIQPKRRIYGSKGMKEGETILRLGDADGKVVARWKFDYDDWMKKMIAILNQFLAYADAQARDMTEEDPIEMARAREKQDFYPAERTWGETTEGSLTPKPGALLRSLKGKKVLDLEPETKER